MSQESLKDKTVKGVGWSAVDNVAQYAVTFVVGVVLARQPEKLKESHYLYRLCHQ